MQEIPKSVASLRGDLENLGRDCTAALQLIGTVLQEDSKPSVKSDAVGDEVSMFWDEVVECWYGSWSDLGPGMRAEGERTNF